MTTRKTTCESRTNAPRKTKRGGGKNPKPSPASYRKLGWLAGLLQRSSELLSRAWRDLRLKRPAHNLRVCEVATLGEKRFVAVVQYGSRRFLVGGGAGSVSLLSNLGREHLPAEPLPADHQRRSNVSNVPRLPLTPSAEDSLPFNVKIAEAAAGARLAI
jgi:flagellar biogenesis protein FliO